MKVVIAGGGTGGHLFPGLAVAEELRGRGHEVHFVGTEQGIEAKVIPGQNFGLDFIDVRGLKGANLRGRLQTLTALPRALYQSLTILRRVKPQLVLGVGGYASGPVLVAAELVGLPTAILEQNSIPGITNRTLGKIVDLVFGTFAAAVRYFPEQKYRLMGNPVRQQIRDLYSARPELVEGASTSLRAAQGERFLLVMGGSQGAQAVNDLVCGAMAILAAKKKAPTLLHQTGANDLARVQALYQTSQVAVTVTAFIDDVASALAQSELVVSRAGATTLSELHLAGVPAILIPYPHAADDHQTSNARACEEKGAAIVCVQEATTAESLAKTIDDLLSNKALLAEMERRARQLSRPRAHLEIVDALEALAGLHPAGVPSVS